MASLMPYGGIPFDDSSNPQQRQALLDRSWLHMTGLPDAYGRDPYHRQLTMWTHRPA